MKLLVVDANSALNRAYYAIRNLTNSKGEVTNAIFGFIRLLDKAIREQRPDALVAAFDLRGPTFRHKIYDGYKKTRKGMDDDLAQQIEPTQRFVEYIGGTVLAVPGYEADDIIGTLSSLCKAQNWECVIATGDRDSFQLVDEGVTVRLSTNQDAIFYDIEKIYETYGVKPKQLVDVKALMGDKSDDIPGVRGIGERSALLLIQQFGSLDTVYQNLDNPQIRAGVRNRLSVDGEKEKAYLSRELGKIALDVPIPSDLNTYRLKEKNCKELFRFMYDMEFHRMLEQYQKKGGSIFENLSIDDVKIEHEVEENVPFSEIKTRLKTCDTVDFLYEEDKLLLYLDQKVVSFTKDIPRALEELVLASGKPLRTYEAKRLYRFGLEHGIRIQNAVFSADIAAYLLEPQASNYPLSGLLVQYQVEGRYDAQYGGVIGIGKLCEILQQKLKEEKMLSLFEEVERPLCRVLASMEKEGVLIDKQGVEIFGEELLVQMNRLELEIYQLTGGEMFKLNSPRELGRVLFDQLGLPKGKKNRSGNYSTGVEVLENLVNAHPAVPKILEYRKVSKLYNTYAAGMVKTIRSDGKIHSNFNQTQTRTGRISSTDPNLQNIPIRTELGAKMRNYFVARDGYQFVDADYSQIELRVLAHISQDPRMIEAFQNGEDIHAITASEVFGIEPILLPPQLRFRAKAINFGIVYGISAFGLASDLHVSVPEAQKYIETYLETYHGVREYMQRIIKEAKETGEVRTLYGRLRKLPELSSNNVSVRNFGERVARNTPIQGTAADIIKMAMVRVNRRLDEERLDAKLVLQVHDELIIEAKEEQVQSAAEILKEEMEQAVSLSVPLEVEVGVGKNWGTAKA